MFVDNRARAVYEQLHVDDYDGGHLVDRFIEDVLASMRPTYPQRLETSFRQKQNLPLAADVTLALRSVVRSRIEKCTTDPVGAKAGLSRTAYSDGMHGSHYRTACVPLDISESRLLRSGDERRDITLRLAD
jgi:hypothetical protein